MSANADPPDFDALWDYDDPAGTEAKFRALLPGAETAGDPDYHLQLLTQIARTQGLQRQFAAAHATLDQVEAALTDDLAVVRVRYLLERGRVFNSSRQPERAVPLFEAALDLAQQHGADFHAVDAAHMLGIAAPPADRLDWNRRALGLAQASADPRAQGWQGALYNNIGWTYHDAGQYEEALAIFRQARDWQEAAGQATEERIARWTIARTLRALGRLDEALAMQRALRAENDALGTPGPYVYEELGECLFALGRPAEARPYFAQAHALLSADPWLVANEPDRLARLAALGAAQDAANE